MLDRLVTEQRNRAPAQIDSVPTAEMLRLLNAEDRRPAEAVGEQIPQIAEAVDRIFERMQRGGRVFYIGAGTSGRLGVLDAAEIPPTYGADPDLFQALIAGGYDALVRSIEGAEDDAEAGASELAAKGFGANDSVVGIAASGRTPYVIGALDEARKRGGLAIALTTNPDSAMAPHADIVIAPVVGPEAIAGSTRMKSGTAQKLTLNMLSTGLMIKRGHVYGNRMVRLKLANEKLWIRARRLVEDIAGCGPNEALAALQATHDVRAAVLICRFGLSPEDAWKRLDDAGGQLRAALESNP
ncbi:MAG: N-acetylmuramic acid 6-phosphate etherase [Bryobacterales bacterium]